MASLARLSMRSSLMPSLLRAPVRGAATKPRPSSFELPNPLAHSASLGRPLSPDLQIYAYQMQYMMSGAFRVAAVVMTAGVITVGAAYPLCKRDFASFIRPLRDLDLPTPVATAIKFTVAFPFTYHVFNGFRHLVWDTTKFVSNPGVRLTGLVVLGTSALTASALAIC